MTLEEDVHFERDIAEIFLADGRLFSFGRWFVFHSPQKRLTVHRVTDKKLNIENVGRQRKRASNLEDRNDSSDKSAHKKT